MRTLAALLLAATAASAQTDDVEVEPITCWWRTSAAAVRVGEPFAVLLTCSLLQTDAARVIADESHLDPGAVQLQPFEVIGGARAEDVPTAGRRFIQFEYRLQLLAENAFATEVALPPLEIRYRIESRIPPGGSSGRAAGSGGAAGSEALQGRDRTYSLPALTVRVLSLVPNTALDIREAPVATFADIDAAAFRGTMLRVLAGILMVFGAIVLGASAVATMRRRRARQSRGAAAVSDWLILHGVERELRAVDEEVRSTGWTSALAGRALASLRILAAYASGRPVTQTPAPAGQPPQLMPRDGQVIVRRRAGAPMFVSAAVAAVDDEDLGGALLRFAAARYGREETFDARLDDDLQTAIRRAERLAAERPLAERWWPR